MHHASCHLKLYSQKFQVERPELRSRLGEAAENTRHSYRYINIYKRFQVMQNEHPKNVMAPDR